MEWGDAHTAQLDAVASTLLVDVLTAEVLDALAAANIDTVLLKGPVLAEWLYDRPELRPYVDVDLLIEPREYRRAEDVIASQGFQRQYRDYEQGRRLEHDGMWTRPGQYGAVDLHRVFPEVRGVAPETLWREIYPRTIDWQPPAPARRVRVLDEPARALLVAVHAAHHLDPERTAPRPIADLELAVERVSFDNWQEAATLAARLRAGPQMAKGLSATPRGRELAARLDLPAPTIKHDDAAGFERLAATRGVRPRLALLLRALFPTPAYLRWSSKLARRGRRGLIAAYLIRPVIVCAYAPRGFMIWRRGRRPDGAPEPAPQGVK